MFCPTCGLEHQEARRFCKRCGTNLEAVSRTLSGILFDPMAAQRLERRQKAMSRAFLMFCLGPGFAIAMGVLWGILWAVQAYDAARIVEALALFGFLFAFIGIVMAINARILYGPKWELLVRRQPPQTLSPEPPMRVASPPTTLTSMSPLQTPPSVTENTTFRLGSQVDFAAGLDTSPTEEKGPSPPQQPFKAKQ